MVDRQLEEIREQLSRPDKVAFYWGQVYHLVSLIDALTKRLEAAEKVLRDIMEYPTDSGTVHMMQLAAYDYFEQAKEEHDAIN